MRLAVKIDQLQEGIRISTDDRGCVFDNIFIERLYGSTRISTGRNITMFEALSITLAGISNVTTQKGHTNQ